MAMKIQYPAAKSSVITPTMMPAAARPRPRSPVSATLRRAAAPSQIPATDPSPPSVRIDRTSDQIAILFVRSAVGGPYSGARVAVSGLDMVVLLLLDDIPRSSLLPAGKRCHVRSAAVEPCTFLYANGQPAVQGRGRWRSQGTEPASAGIPRSSPVKATEVSRICADLDTEVAAFGDRSLAGQAFRVAGTPGHTLWRCLRRAARRRGGPPRRPGWCRAARRYPSSCLPDRRSRRRGPRRTRHRWALWSRWRRPLALLWRARPPHQAGRR